jgi:hypothetical protein
MGLGILAESRWPAVAVGQLRLSLAALLSIRSSNPFNIGLRKFGAIVGDRAEIGCNSVISPGSIIGRDTILYPGTSWRGVLPNNSIGKAVAQTLKILPRQTRD